jgi:streptomycin 6-kinase
MVEVPAVVREKALAVGAEVWLETLPLLVRSLEAEWCITVGHAYPSATDAFVAEALCDDGGPAVLKLVVPRDGSAAAHETTALRLADGEGCPRLLRDDVRRGALLLERLGGPLHELELPVGRRHEILVSAARRVWRPTPDCGLPTGADKAGALAEFIATMWEELDRPCSRRAVDHALDCAAGAAMRTERRPAGFADRTEPDEDAIWEWANETPGQILHCNIRATSRRQVMHRRSVDTVSLHDVGRIERRLWQCKI